MRKKLSSKLRLSSETLRNLDSNEMRLVKGAGTQADHTCPYASGCVSEAALCTGWPNCSGSATSQDTTCPDNKGL
jgi:hypothetical protein